MDWDTEHNGEPYWRDYHEMDLIQAYQDAGLKAKMTEAHSEWAEQRAIIWENSAIM